MNNLPIIEEEIQQNASKAAPTSIQQKRQHVAIVARVPDIISSFFFNSFVCAKTRVHLHFPPCEPRAFQLTSNFASKTPRSQRNFIHFSKMPLQSTCFQIQFYLVCCSFFCSISRTPLSISSHFAIGRKFPLKASFYTLTHSPQYSNSILFTTIAKQEANAYFHISPSYCLFHSNRKKIHFRIQIDLQLNFIQIIRSSFFLPSSYSTIAKEKTVLFFPTTISKHLSQLPLSSSALWQFERSCVVFFTFPLSFFSFLPIHLYYFSFPFL